ncbi:MAG: threonine synthase [Lachnospiraceae bacterium]|nr:threonine synthase [Lachnospiraceae bacterium]
MSKTGSFAIELYCSKCGKTYALNEIHQLCECGAPLLVRYDLESAKAVLSADTFRNRPANLWRYKELLPVADDENIVSLGEGMTPILPLSKLGRKIGLPDLYMKDEGVIPTGTFKARGASVGVSRAKELGVKKLAMPTNGNAGAAWSIYSARAGIKAEIIMPEDAPKITRNECAAAGAELYLVRGLISDCGKIVAKHVKENGLYDASTLKEPYRIEGKKTMGLEIAEQFDWKLPDAIFYPTGGGVGIIGIYKALRELKELGIIEGKLPKLISVQAKGCAPIVRAFEKRKEASEFFEDSQTIAFGINVPKALGDFIVLKALYETGGTAVSVSDEEIIEAVKELAANEGTFVCPEGAANFAAAEKLVKSGFLKETDRVVLLNTGAGIKYPDTLTAEVPYLEKMV